MPLFFFGKSKKEPDADPRLAEEVTELLESYNRLTDTVLIDTIRNSEALLDRTGMSDIDRTLWGADFPKEDVESLAKDEENLKAVKKTVKLLYHQITSQDAALTQLNYEMRDLIGNRGTSFTQYNAMQIGVFHKGVKASEKMRKLLQLRILDDNGKLNPEASAMAESFLA